MWPRGLRGRGNRGDKGGLAWPVTRPHTRLGSLITISMCQSEGPLRRLTKGSRRNDVRARRGARGRRARVRTHSRAVTHTHIHTINTIKTHETFMA